MPKNLNRTNFREFELANYWFDENGLFCARQKDGERTIKKEKAAFDLIDRMAGGKKICMYVDTTDCPVLILDDECKVLAAHELERLCKAVAVLTTSVLHKIAPTIFLNTMGEPVPIRMFHTEKEAKEWLMTFM